MAYGLCVSDSSVVRRGVVEGFATDFLNFSFSPQRNSGSSARLVANQILQSLALENVAANVWSATTYLAGI